MPFSLALPDIPQRWPRLVLPAMLAAGLLWAFTPDSSIHKKTVHRGLRYAPEGDLNRRVKSIYPESFDGEEGHYVRLLHGEVKYWIVGPEDGKKVVLIHGLTIPSFVFRQVARILSKSGFRVLLFDLYGRGYTDAPEVEYNVELYIAQVALLMQYIKWDKAFVAGLSMGGAIAGAFAATFPHLVDRRVVFIASAGAMSDTKLGSKHPLTTSRFAQSLIRFAVWRRTKSVAPVSTHSALPTSPADQVRELVSIQTSLLPGFTPAVTSSILHGPLSNQKKAFEALGERIVHVLLIWGTADEIVPFRNAGVLKGYMPQAELVEIKDAGHDVTVTHAEEVAKALVEFFGR